MARLMFSEARTSLMVLCASIILSLGCGNGSENKLDNGSAAGAGTNGAGGSSSGASGSSAGSMNAAGEGGSAGVSGSAGDAGAGGDAGSNGAAGATGQGGSGCVVGDAGHGSAAGEDIPQEGCPPMGGSGGSAGGDAGAGGSVAGAGGSSGSSAGDAGAAGSTAGAGGSAGDSGAGGSVAGMGGAGGSAGSSAGVGGSGAAGVGGSSGSSGAGGSVAGAGGAGGSSGMGGSAAGVGGAGGTSGMGGTGGSSGMGGSAGAGNGGTGGQVTQTFTCTNEKREIAFDAANQDKFDVPGGIWGSAADDVWIGMYSAGIGAAMYHSDGVSFTKFALPGSPTEIHSVWGSAPNDVWVAARSTVGLLYHWNGGSWTQETSVPKAKRFTSLWGSGPDNMWLMGADDGWMPAVWRRVGGSWVKQVLPVLDPMTEIKYMWGVDNHVFLTGFINDTQVNPVAAVVLRFDGSKWSQVKLDASLARCSQIHGTSVDDLWLACDEALDLKGVILNWKGMSSWSMYKTTEVVEYTSIWSAKPGTAWAGGVAAYENGSLRITTIDANGPQTKSVDKVAYVPRYVWAAPKSNQMWILTIRPPAGAQVAAVYTETCN